MEQLLRTRVTDEYGALHPVVCAGMGFVAASPDLGIAVTNAGGIGALCAALIPADGTRLLIGAMRSATGGRPFHANLITPYVLPGQIEACAEEGVPIVSFHWGNPPRETIERLHAGGCRVWEQVGSLDAARRAVESGVDLVVAQGSEAGGHNFATLPTFAFVPAVVDAVSPTPVLAAGGIGDGRGLAAALALGAEGAWIGTRFVATREADAHDEYRSRLVGAAGTDTVRTSVLGPDMPGFNPYRVLRNPVIDEQEGSAEEPPGDLSGEPLIGSTVLGGQRIPIHRLSSFIPTAGAEGELSLMAMPAGEGVGLVRSVLGAADVVEELVREAARALARPGPAR
jgi:NAD(P)H-dependent flavin oxidoreductase YrpB (nitropropane dioxygenase family)